MRVKFDKQQKPHKDKPTRYINMQFPSYKITYNNALDALTCPIQIQNPL